MAHSIATTEKTQVFNDLQCQEIREMLHKGGMAKDIGAKISKLWTEFQGMSRNLPSKLYPTSYLKARNHEIIDFMALKQQQVI